MTESKKLSGHKKEFAALVAKGESPFDAALLILDDRVKAIDSYMLWMKDEEVISYIDEIKKVDRQERVGSSEDGEDRDKFNDQLLTMFTSRQYDIESRLKAGKLYAEINGYIKKAEAVTNVQINQAPTVMLVPQNGNNDNWENSLESKQARLMDQSAEPTEAEIEDVG